MIADDGGAAYEAGYHREDAGSVRLAARADVRAGFPLGSPSAAELGVVPVVDALRRHAPHLPVAGVDRLDTGAMSDAVHRARALARAGDTVLLAPAADLDRRAGSEPGQLFRTAVARLAAGAGA